MIETGTNSPALLENIVYPNRSCRVKNFVTHSRGPQFEDFFECPALQIGKILHPLDFPTPYLNFFQYEQSCACGMAPLLVDLAFCVSACL